MDTTIPFLDRRQFLAGVAASALPGLASGGREATQPPVARPVVESPLCIFSKHLHWLPVEQVGHTAAELGFAGVDLSVRKGGHVDPARVKTDLPVAVRHIQRAGLQVPMIATDIIDADHPQTEILLRAASESGIRYYRTAYLKYDPALDIRPNLEQFRKQLQKLAVLNQKYNIQAAYQNHAGVNLGAAVWDLWEVVKDMDPRWMGCQYDIKHAVAEGGQSWVNGLNALKSHIHCLAIKDFVWAETGGTWRQKHVPLGTGMVDYPAFISRLGQYNIRGPMSLHFEYPLGGAEHGKKELTLDRSEVLAAMQRDLNTFKRLLLEAKF